MNSDPTNTSKLTAIQAGDQQPRKSIRKRLIPVMFASIFALAMVSAVTSPSSAEGDGSVKAELRSNDLVISGLASNVE